MKTINFEPFFFLAPLLLSMLSLVTPAEAAPSAESLVKEGLELRRAGRDAEALPKFEAAYRTSATPRAAAQWGLCLQALSRWSEADPLLAEALSATEDPWVKRNRETLKESQEAIKSHVGRIEVLGDPPGASVTIAGRGAGALPLEAAIVVNEGLVDVEVSAPGYERAVRTLTVAGASYQRVVLRLHRIPESSPPAVKNRDDAPFGYSGPEDHSPSTPAYAKSWFWAGVGAVAVVAVTAAIFLSGGTRYPEVDASRRIP